MTKKHFEAIAHTLNANMAPLSLVMDLADMFAEENPRFDRKRFVAAATQRLYSQATIDAYLLGVAHGKK